MLQNVKEALGLLEKWQEIISSVLEQSGFVQIIALHCFRFPRYSYKHSRIRNKIPDRDWFSARLFVTQSARDHVGVQLQVSNLTFW